MINFAPHPFCFKHFRSVRFDSVSSLAFISYVEKNPHFNTELIFYGSLFRFFLQSQTTGWWEEFITWIAWILKNARRELVTKLLPLCFDNTKYFLYATKTSDWGWQATRFLMLAHKRNAYEFLLKVNFLEKDVDLKYDLLIIVRCHFLR